MARGSTAAVLGAIAAGAYLLAAPAAWPQQSRKEVCDGDLRTEEQRIKAGALAKEKQVVDDAAKLNIADRVPQMRAAIARNMIFELAWARQNHEDCLKLP